MDDLKPGWVILGGCMLAFLVAALNASFMIRIGTSVSHLTGDLSRFAVGLVTENPIGNRGLRHLAAALTSFVMGAAVAGFFLHHPTLDISRPYGRSVAAIGVTVVTAYWFLGRSQDTAIALTGLACGFQNALATHFRGIVLRTTHVTGLLTDLGMTLGMKARGRAIAGWKALVPASLVVCFFGGALVGSFLTLRCGDAAVLIIGLSYIAAGVGWTLIKHLVLRVGRAH